MEFLIKFMSIKENNGTFYFLSILNWNTIAMTAPKHLICRYHPKRYHFWECMYYACGYMYHMMDCLLLQNHNIIS